MWSALEGAVERILVGRVHGKELHIASADILGISFVSVIVMEWETAER